MLSRRSFVAAVAALFSPLSSVFAKKPPKTIRIWGYDVPAEYLSGRIEATIVNSKTLVYRDNYCVGYVTKFREEKMEGVGSVLMADVKFTPEASELFGDGVESVRLR
jgi:hypothetical protein